MFDGDQNLYKSRAIARIEFHNGIVWFLCHCTHFYDFLLVFVCRLQWIIRKKRQVPERTSQIT